MAKTTFTGTLAAVVALTTLALPASPVLALAKGNFNHHPDQAFTPVYGNTSAPIGYVDFCRRNGDECRQVAGNTRKLALTMKRWMLLGEVNSFVNRKIAPVSDEQLYSVPERWQIPTNAGDCEDYVLLKKRYLEGLGFPAETLLITVVLDENGGGHAVLTVRSDIGDFVLDNRRDDIRLWAATGYTFIKRQSQADPNLWVSLTRKKRQPLKALSGR